MFKLSIWTGPMFFKLTTLEVRIRTFLILTHWHSCALNGCLGDIPTHSLAFMLTHKCPGRVQCSLKSVHAHSKAFRVFSILNQKRQCTLTSIKEVFNTDSKVFMCTHKHSGGVQCWLKGIHVHSQAFRECSVLTQTRSFSWSHHGELHSIMTQWRSCALNWCSGGVQYSLIGVHAHSMGVQGLFALTHPCSCALNGCSGAVLTHSLAFTCTHKCSCSCTWRPNEYVFKFANADAL